MPIPFLLAGAAVLLGGVGAVGHSVAKDNNKEAERIIENAEDKYHKAMKNLDYVKEETSNCLASYGELKLSVNAGVIKQYVEQTKRLKSDVLTKVIKGPKLDKYKIEESDLISKSQFRKIETASKNSVEIFSAGITSLGTGVLASIGTYSGISMLATASTGTAISTLSGAAATNATMAWLGGGALATGGLGMAGGAAMLGGVTLGPAILVSSIFAGVKSIENLDDANRYKNEVNLKVAEIAQVISRLEAIQLRAGEAERVLTKLSDVLSVKLEEFEKVVTKQIKFNKVGFFNKFLDKLLVALIKNRKSKYLLSDEDMKVVVITELLVNRIHGMMEAKILGSQGELTNEIDMIIKDAKVQMLIA